MALEVDPTNLDILTRIRQNYDILMGEKKIRQIEKKIEKILNNAWQLQKLIDRLAGSNPKQVDPAYNTAEDNVDGLVDWFATEKKELGNR